MKILVVDDEPDMKTLFLQSFRREIRNGEIDFSFAFSGEEALEFLKIHESEIILILSDINMPGMSGIQLLRKIRQKFATPPPVVMIITAFGDKENLEDAMESGADDFLNKPIDFTSLKEKIKSRV